MCRFGCRNKTRRELCCSGRRSGPFQLSLIILVLSLHANISTACLRSVRITTPLPQPATKIVIEQEPKRYWVLPPGSAVLRSWSGRSIGAFPLYQLSLQLHHHNCSPRFARRPWQGIRHSRGTPHNSHYQPPPCSTHHQPGIISHSNTHKLREWSIKGYLNTTPLTTCHRNTPDMIYTGAGTRH